MSWPSLQFQLSEKYIFFFRRDVFKILCNPLLCGASGRALPHILFPLSCISSTFVFGKLVMNYFPYHPRQLHIHTHTYTHILDNYRKISALNTRANPDCNLNYESEVVTTWHKLKRGCTQKWKFHQLRGSLYWFCQLYCSFSGPFL